LADPWTHDCRLLIRFFPKAIEHMLDVHVACDESRALVAHAPQHSFPALVDERDLIKIHDAFAALG
jgi:hypothetical protein